MGTERRDAPVGVQFAEPVRPKLVGGVFGLESISHPSGSSPPFLTPGAIAFANASSGLAFLLGRVRPDRLWLPSFLCHALIDAANVAGVPVVFYEVDAGLTVTTAFVDEVRPRDAVLVIDYFGFVNPGVAMLKGLMPETAVIEDATQALLTKGVGELSDFVLYSPRKFAGIPDGGVLLGYDGEPANLEDGPADWWLTSLAANLGRAEYDRHGGGRGWFDEFQAAERKHPIGAFRMSRLSRLILETSIDYKFVATTRRENYATLLESIGHLALMPILDDNAVPLGFPVVVDDRAQLRKRLFENEIYPPIHWPIENLVPPSFNDSHRLSGSILTIPCDQRYDRDDMQRVADAILAAIDAPQYGE